MTYDYIKTKTQKESTQVIFPFAISSSLGVLNVYIIRELFHTFAKITQKPSNLLNNYKDKDRDLV